jgi:DNA-binding XRE family transcriptional regulator
VHKCTIYKEIQYNALELDSGMERKYKPMIKLKLKRIEKGYLQSDLAKLVGVSQHSISTYELGYKFPRRNVLDKLAEVLECDAGDLI